MPSRILRRVTALEQRVPEHIARLILASACWPLAAVDQIITAVLLCAVLSIASQRTAVDVKWV